MARQDGVRPLDVLVRAPQPDALREARPGALARELEAYSVAAEVFEPGSQRLRVVQSAQQPLGVVRQELRDEQKQPPVQQYGREASQAQERRRASQRPVRRELVRLPALLSQRELQRGVRAHPGEREPQQAGASRRELPPASLEW